MNRRKLTRRTFLRGLGGAAIALPMLEATLPGLAHAEPENASNGKFPKRFVVFFHPNGVIPDAWWPTRTGDNPGDFEDRKSVV